MKKLLMTILTLISISAFATESCGDHMVKYLQEYGPFLSGVKNSVVTSYHDAKIIFKSPEADIIEYNAIIDFFDPKTQEHSNKWEYKVEITVSNNNKIGVPFCNVINKKQTRTK